MSGEEAGRLTPLQDLRARLVPGALCFALAAPERAGALRADLASLSPAWVGWRRREALLKAWRPAAQERYHSVAGRDAPALRVWLEGPFSVWRPDGRGIHSLRVDQGRLAEALELCGLADLADRPLSLFSNGEAARACLAAALGPEPDLLVLDDLCEGLDARGRGILWKAAAALAGRGAAVLVLASRESLLPWAVTRVPDISAVPFQEGAEVFACEGVDLPAGERCLVKALNWTLREGEAWWLKGANGAGKSTLLAYLSGEHPQAWAQSWTLCGRGRFHWTPPAALRRNVAWVSPELAAVAQRSLGGMLDEALEGGASLLLLDEVLRGLDAEALEAAETKMAAALRKRPRLCVVFVSHDSLEIPAWINRILSLGGDGTWVSS